MGRPKKPLSLQKGNLTQQEINEKMIQEQSIKTGMDQLENPPKWLTDNKAKKEWNRLVEQFKQLSIISNLDLNNLGCYCNAYSSYLDVTKKLQGQDLLMEYTNKAGATNAIENPLIKIQMKYSDEMRRYSALLGLTIDSRLKMASLKLTETESVIVDKFGDI